MSQSHITSECRVSSLTSLSVNNWIDRPHGSCPPRRFSHGSLSSHHDRSYLCSLYRSSSSIICGLCGLVDVVVFFFFRCVIWSVRNLNASLPACTGLFKLLQDEYNFIAFLLTLEVPIATHIQFLPTITLPRKWMKWSPKMKCCDVRTNSLKQYHKECMKNSVEKMHVDVRA